jgi:hypothetical protein
MAELLFLAGYIDENGELHRDFTIRDLDGEDEEVIAKKENQTNGSKVVRVILERCIERIGIYEKSKMPSKKWLNIIQSLLIGDQDYAVMQIRKESLGEEMGIKNICPYCKEKLKTIIDIDEIKTLPFIGAREISFELPKGYTDKDGVVHKNGKMRLPNGLDREILDPVARRNLGSANTLLLTRLITEFEGLKIHDGLLKKMSIRDREYLLSLLDENKFGPDMRIEVTCSTCGETFESASSVENFI